MYFNSVYIWIISVSVGFNVILASVYIASRIRTAKTRKDNRVEDEEVPNGDKIEAGQKLALLDKTSNQLTASLEKNILVKAILDIFVDFPGVDKAFLLLYNYDTSEFLFELGHHLDKTMFRQPTFKLSIQTLRKIDQEMKTMIMPLSRTDEGEALFSFVEPSTHPAESYKAVLIPLSVENAIAAVVVLYCFEESLDFLNDNRQILSIMKNQASVAIGSAIQNELAVFDRLTMIYNRAYLMKRLNEEVKRCIRYKSPISLMMIDIDHFKRINDTFGHQVGDMVLRRVAKIIDIHTRIVDLCARYGGEEFVIMLPETSLEGAVAVAEREMTEISNLDYGGAITLAERLREEIEKETFNGNIKSTIKITISIGVTSWSGTGGKQDISGDIILGKADEQVYKAKSLGRNRVCHEAIKN